MTGAIGHTRSARSRLAVAGAAVLLIVAACGGSTGSSPSTSAGASTATGAPPSVASSAPSPSDQAPSADTASDVPSASDQTASNAPSDAPSDSPAEPSAAAVDPCSLITVSEANAVAGVKTLPPEPAGIPPVRCVWATPTSGAVGQVEIDVGDGAKKTYDIDKTILKHTFTPIPGLGDEAYAEDSTVFFRTGDTWVAIHVVRLDDSKVWMPKLIALAKTVATRL